MDLINQPVGTEGTLNVKLSKGKVILTLQHKHASGNASVVVEEDASYFFKKLGDLIPGKLDDAILALIDASVKALE